MVVPPKTSRPGWWLNFQGLQKKKYSKSSNNKILLALKWQSTPQMLKAQLKGGLEVILILQAEPF